MRHFEPKGPLVNSEFYPGWLDYWGQPHNKVILAFAFLSVGVVLECKLKTHKQSLNLCELDFAIFTA